MTNPLVKATALDGTCMPCWVRLGLDVEGKTPENAWEMYWREVLGDLRFRAEVVFPSADHLAECVHAGDLGRAETLMNAPSPGEGYPSPSPTADHVLEAWARERTMVSRRVTRWCQARGATGREAFVAYCRSGGFYQARWLLEHGGQCAGYNWACDEQWLSKNARAHRAKLLRLHGVVLHTTVLPPTSRRTATATATATATPSPAPSSARAPATRAVACCCTVA